VSSLQVMEKIREFFTSDGKKYVISLQVMEKYVSSLQVMEKICEFFASDGKYMRVLCKRWKST
jgi:hypothetical protein